MRHGGYQWSQHFVANNPFPHFEMLVSRLWVDNPTVVVVRQDAAVLIPSHSQ